MLRKLETWAAASGLAQEGDQQTALALLSEMKTMDDGKSKILVIGSDDSITSEIALHLSNLARRLSSELVFISSNSIWKEKIGLPEGLLKLKELMGSDGKLTYVPAQGHVEQTVRYVEQKARRLEFAVLIGHGNRALCKLLKQPVFSM